MKTEVHPICFSCGKPMRGWQRKISTWFGFKHLKCWREQKWPRASA